MRRFFQISVFVVVLSGCASSVNDIKPDTGAKKFSSANHAAEAFRTAVLSTDRTALLSILGNDAEELLSSGDKVADKNNMEKFAAKIGKKFALEEQPDGHYIILVGDKDWPFAIPIVSDGEQWYFDIEAGREELLDRRIGENELRTIRFVRAYVEAQKDYFKKDRDGDGVREYAQKGFSSPGKKDGLYWPSAGKEEASPFGDLAAEAQREGYRREGEGPVPFHGYYFKILTAQGEQADGGKNDYLDTKGNMTKGFGLLAYPARFGSSGIMSFVVNQDGVVYQKDLGIQTLAAAESMKEFNPDLSWDPVADPREDAVED